MTLEDVVKEFLSEAEYTQHKALRLQKIAVRGLLDMHMDVSGFPTTTELEINSDTLTAPLPSDYITYRKIGYVSAGVIVPFAENPRIKLYPPDGGCEPPNENNQVTETALSNGFYNYPYWGAYGVSTLAPNGLYGGFSTMGGSAAYICDFRIDELNGQVQFGLNPDVTIVMEYLANPKMVNGKYTVHPFDVSAIMAWMAWRDIENTKGVPSNEKNRKMSEYYRERGQARKRHYNNNLAKAYQKVRQTNQTAPRY